jgi:hypothetical protein
MIMVTRNVSYPPGTWKTAEIRDSVEIASKLVRAKGSYSGMHVLVVEDPEGDSRAIDVMFDPDRWGVPAHKEMYWPSRKVFASVAHISAADAKWSKIQKVEESKSGSRSLKFMIIATCVCHRSFIPEEYLERLFESAETLLV